MATSPPPRPARSSASRPAAFRALADSGDLASRWTSGGHRRFAEADVLAYRERHGAPRGLALRERIWTAAVLAVLRDAEADLGEPAAARFRAAATLLNRH